MQRIKEISFQQKFVNYSTQICLHNYGQIHLKRGKTLPSLWESQLLHTPVMTDICQLGNSVSNEPDSNNYRRWSRLKVQEELNPDKQYSKLLLSAAPSPPLKTWMKWIVSPTILSSRPLTSTGTSREWEEAGQKWEARWTEVFLLFLLGKKILIFL